MLTYLQFCVLPCEDIFEQAIKQALPPPRLNSPPAPDVPIFVNSTNGTIAKRDVLDPPYRINNFAEFGNLSSHTSWVSYLSSGAFCIWF